MAGEMSQSKTLMDGLFQLNQGSDIAVGSTIQVPDDGNFYDITGSSGTTITTIQPRAAGTVLWFRNQLSAGALLAIDQSDNIVIPQLGPDMDTSVNINIRNGEVFSIVSIAGTDWMMIPITGVVLGANGSQAYRTITMTLNTNDLGSTDEEAIVATAQRTMSGNTASGTAASILMSPTYFGSAGSYTLSEHQYFRLNDVIEGSGATVTQAVVFRFNDDAATHKALKDHSGSGTPVLQTGANAPGTGDPIAWIRVNIDGATGIIPVWAET